jgi:integrase
VARRQRRSRGHIEARSNGSFRAIVYAGVDPLTGKQRYLRKTAKTYPLAGIELTKLLTQVDEQRHPRSDATVARIVENWLEVSELAETTRQRYEGLVRLYIAPTFGSMSAGEAGRRTTRALLRAASPLQQAVHRPSE